MFHFTAGGKGVLLGWWEREVVELRLDSAGNPALAGLASEKIP
jgi:hypothetical protein